MRRHCTWLRCEHFTAHGGSRSRATTSPIAPLRPLRPAEDRRATEENTPLSSACVTLAVRFETTKKAAVELESRAPSYRSANTRQAM